MPFLIEHVIAFVVTLVVLVSLAAALLVGIALARRQRRERYFQHLDALRQEYGPAIAGILDGSHDYQQGLAVLLGFEDSNRLAVLELLLMDRRPAATQMAVWRQLCEDLGLVKRWQERLKPQAGPSLVDLFTHPGRWIQRLGRLEFLGRAKAAENLGAIQHQPSWSLLAEALKDRHPDVRAVAARSLALIQEPRSFPALVEQLHSVILTPSSELSLRTIKSTLVSFPLAQAAGLVGSLKHAQRRIRFFATDIIREMVEREAAAKPGFVLRSAHFGSELVEIFLTRLPTDENPDVRARSASVVSYLQDERATRVLVMLLEDREWFVRLHAVRALARSEFSPLLAPISQRLTDPHWLVREAAVRTLLAFDQAGAQKLNEHFLLTQDRYSQQQIADEWQRAGAIPSLMAQYAAETDGQVGRVVEQLANMGRTSYILSVVLGYPDRNLHRKFLQQFGRHPDPQIQAWVRGMTQGERDPELRALAQAQLPPGAR